METTLIFLEGLELPCFATFPLLETRRGPRSDDAVLRAVFRRRRDEHGAGFVLEANTWRANPSWGAQLGYSLDELAEANRRCIAFAEEARAREEVPGCPIVISAPFGPEGDAYDPAEPSDGGGGGGVSLLAGRSHRRDDGRLRSRA